MASWPSIKSPTFGTKEEIFKPQIRTSFEGGYVQSRPKGTRSVYRWTLTWRAMPDADWETLLAFFDSEQGNQIDDFPRPKYPAQTFSVRFAADGLTSSIEEGGFRAVEVVVEQV